MIGSSFARREAERAINEFQKSLEEAKNRIQDFDPDRLAYELLELKEKTLRLKMSNTFALNKNDWQIFDSIIEQLVFLTEDRVERFSDEKN